MDGTDFGHTGDTALVSASSSGLGKASAKALASEGANVVVNGRSNERLTETVADIEAVATGEVLGVPGDITEEREIAALVDATVAEFGGLDHLVTSAGGPPTHTFAETENDHWYDAYDLLVMSVVRLVREAGEYLRDGSGTVTNITSIVVKEASETNVLSSSVRMSVIGLMKTLSHEFAPDVRVNALLPTGLDTPRLRDVLRDKTERGLFDSVEDALGQRSDAIPVDRVGDPMSPGNTVVYLCSDHARFINGVAIPIDGGFSRSNL